MRLDEWLVFNSFAEDIKIARGMILSANVLVNDVPVTSAALNLKDPDNVRIRNQRRWVARSAEKLEFALNTFNLNVSDKICLDVGCSTGGFTQVLLARGARQVIALDVAYGFLHPSLRNNSAVHVMERTHICGISPNDLVSKPDMFVVDVSFISLERICQCLKALYSSWQGIVLFKPQFEVDKQFLQNGIITDKSVLDASIAKFKRFLETMDINILNEAESPITGKKGNHEFLFHLSWY